ncbi:hypothetical protein ESCO_003957 [Escovopsis weberi]|uniref:Uncharacterized protein n=1 Tax=Escovopsis weberi TaxID=150374 RepID=A0A0M9VX60_ESCWE|nr:hypothetical protein ESCO_003957 [Escovopsis weberi]
MSAQFRKQRSLESLRSDFVFEVLHTKGLYFMNQGVLMQDKPADKELSAILCPRLGESAVMKAWAYLKILFVECHTALDATLRSHDKRYWQVVVAAARQKCKIDLPWYMAQDLVFRILKAHQRWLIPQASLPEQELGIFLGHVQTLLRRLEREERREEEGKREEAIKREEHQQDTRGLPRQRPVRKRG